MSKMDTLADIVFDLSKCENVRDWRGMCVLCQSHGGHRDTCPFVRAKEIVSGRRAVPPQRHPELLIAELHTHLTMMSIRHDPHIKRYDARTLDDVYGRLLDAILHGITDWHRNEAAYLATRRPPTMIVGDDGEVTWRD